MVNTYSPAHWLPVADDTPPASPRVRYPSPPPALRWLRWQLRLLQAVTPGLAARLAWRIFTTPRRLPAKPWEAVALAGSQAGWVPYAGGRVATYAWGPPTAPAVILVHGWEHRASFWGAWVAPLLAAGYRVLALDGPAHGRTAGRRTTLPEFGAATQAVVDFAALSGGPVRAVVAHSFGAAAAVALPLAPPPGQPSVPRLVLLSAPVSPRVVAGRFAELLGVGPAVLGRLGARMHRLVGRDLRELAVPVAGPRLPVGLTLLVHDEHDAIVPFAEAQQITAAWPAARLLTTTGLGHNRILRDAVLVRQVVEFLV